MKASYYMHTLGGKAAAFDGKQVAVGVAGRKVAASLEQIRREQVLDQEYRRRKGFTYDRGALGYVRFRLPDAGGEG